MPAQASSMQRKISLIVLVTICLLPACSSIPNQMTGQLAAASILQEECHLSAPGASARLPARCGTLAVAENPSNPNGKQINLRIAVIPAISRNPASDPLFFITGGPGQAASESYPLVSQVFERLNQKRDIVLIDQRGTGGSNSLNCETDDLLTGDDLEPEELGEYLHTCLSSLDADPRFYSTPFAVADLDKVRQVLGYPKINLYGISYGTRVALEYLRRYPQRVRTIVLDGVVPPQEALGDDVAHDAQYALEQIFNRCDTDRDCHQAFPEVRQEFNQLLKKLQIEPVSLSVSDPISGEIVSLTFTAELFGVTIRLLSYSQETVALLPLLIHTTAATGDFRLMAAQYLMVGGDLSRLISQGMGYSVLCSEDAPFYDYNRRSQAVLETYLGDQQIEDVSQVCEVWPSAEIPEDFKQPITADVPALLLSGEFDPVTPPENAELVAQGLVNSLHLVAAGQGHNVVIRGCLPRVTTDFIEKGSASELDVRCVQTIQPAPFFVNLSGPAP